MAFQSIDRWDLYTVALSDFDADGYLSVQPDAYGESESGLAAVELHSPYGFSARPLDPDTDASGAATMGCMALIGWEGGKGHAWLSYDPRAVPGLPPIKKGESIQYGPKQNFIRCHADGAITLMTTTDGTSAGQAVYRRCKPDGFLDVGPWGHVRFDKTGYVVQSNYGPRLVMGGVSGLPGPLSSLSGYTYLQSHTTTIDSSMIALGPVGSGALSSPVVKADPLAAALLAAATAVGASATSGPAAPVAAAVATALKTIAGLLGPTAPPSSPRSLAVSVV